MEKVLLIKYGEIALRKRNRYIFENKIISAIRRNLYDFGDFYVQREQGRFILKRLDGELDFPFVIERVRMVLGITGVCPCMMFEQKDIAVINQVAYETILPFCEAGLSFKVNTRRAYKDFPLDSIETSREVGRFLMEKIPMLSVDVHKPDIMIQVEIRTQVYVYCSRDVVKTFGGLPAGSSGRGLLLLSGGIDSPVAYFQLAKRGVEVLCIHFDTPPFTSDRALLKVQDLAERLSHFTETTKLFVVPITEIQMYLVKRVPEEKLTIFLKRAMTQLAARVAEREKAVCLITGDSIGQVASQTLQAIHAVSAGVDMPIMRPLSGMSKQEIIDIAKEIGTFDISIRPYEDCCTTFVPKHPDLKPKTSVILGMERKMDEMPGLIETALEKMNVLTFGACD